MKAYHVIQWGAAHETWDSRKYKTLAWFRVPSKQDGVGFRAVTRQPNREALYGTWVAILAVACRTDQPYRGWLVRGDQALTPLDLSLMTGFRERCFAAALKFFSEPYPGWLELVEFPPIPGESPGTAGDSPGIAGDSPDTKTGESPACQEIQAATVRYGTVRKVQGGTIRGDAPEKAGGKGQKGNGAGERALRTQFAALSAQIKALEAREDALDAEERRELREKNALLRKVQHNQAHGIFEVVTPPKKTEKPHEK
jgi:hypothetical protein